MLDVLHEAEKSLPQWLEDPGSWKSLYIDYEPPFVERLWRTWGEHRVYLHRIHPCNKALFHPHGWPSAMRIVHGIYEMELGWGPGDQPPPVASTLLLPAGTEYEMIDRDSWHSVRPLREVLSLMVTGQPWDRWSPRSTHPLRGLTDLEINSLFDDFRQEYPL